MSKILHENKIVIFMTDIRNHIGTINRSIKLGDLKRSKVVGTITNNTNTFKHFKYTDEVPVVYSKWDKKKETRGDYDKMLVDKVNELGGDTIVLTGWKHIFTPTFYNSFRDVINIHPALPNSYVGLNCIKKSLDDYKIDKTKDKTGVMIHKVIEELDRGEVLDYIQIPIFEYDDIDDLTDRFREYERLPLVRALQKLEREDIE